MATRKHKKRTHGKNKSNKRRSRKQKGGCGQCGASKVGIFGGNPTGPIPGPDTVPIRYYYGLNDHVADPTNPSAVVDARLAGGNSRRRKQKGGFSYVNTDVILGASAYNVPASFGSHVQIPVGYSLFSGTAATNPSVYDQPVGSKYNDNNPALA